MRSSARAVPPCMRAAPGRACKLLQGRTVLPCGKLSGLLWATGVTPANVPLLTPCSPLISAQLNQCMFHANNQIVLFLSRIIQAHDNTEAPWSEAVETMYQNPKLVCDACNHAELRAQSQDGIHLQQHFASHVMLCHCH